MIVTAAFTPKAVTGGAVGSMFVAMQKGVARGIFSNEAGLRKRPDRSSCCTDKRTCPSGTCQHDRNFYRHDRNLYTDRTLHRLNRRMAGRRLRRCGSHHLRIPAGTSFPSGRVPLCINALPCIFAFTTILGWDYYSERCLEYLSGGNLKHVKVYRWIYIFAVFIGPYMTVSAVWTIADIFNGLMALPNMIALFALSGLLSGKQKRF